MTRIQFPWTEDADAMLIRMRAEKKPFSAIVTAIGCTERAAEARSSILRRRGIEVWVGRNATKKTPEATAKLRDLIAQGKSTDAAGAKLGISGWTARRWLLVMERQAANLPSTSTQEPGISDARNGNIIWTAAIDAKLIALRNAQSSWRDIAHALGVAEKTAFTRALVLRDRGAAMWGAPTSVRNVQQDGDARTDLRPLPPGSPETMKPLMEPWDVFHERLFEGDRAL